MKIKDGLLVNALQRPTPNRSGVLQPEVVVLHDTAGRLAGTGSVAWLRNPVAKASAHVVIGRDGKVWQLTPFTTKTWHAGKSSFKGRPSVNNFGIGIELVNPGKLQPHGSSQAKAWHGEVYGRSKYGIEHAETPYHGAGLWMPYTQAQVTTVLGILATLRGEYPSIKEATTHWFISPGRKIDTNPLFPLKYIQSRFEGRESNGPDANDASAKVTLITGAEIRQWPSFFPENVLETVREEDTEFQVVSHGVFEHKGPDSPPCLQGTSSLWYKVRFGDGGSAGWVHTSYTTKE